MKNQKKQFEVWDEDGRSMDFDTPVNIVVWAAVLLLSMAGPGFT